LAALETAQIQGIKILEGGIANGTEQL